MLPYALSALAGVVIVQLCAELPLGAACVALALAASICVFVRLRLLPAVALLFVPLAASAAWTVARARIVLDDRLDEALENRVVV